MREKLYFLLKYKIDLSVLSGLMAVMLLYFRFVFKISYAHLQYPLMYSGAGDSLGHLMFARNIIDTGWITSSIRLGLNGKEFFYDYPTLCLSNIGNLLLKIYLWITGGNIAFAVNLEILTCPFFTVAVTYVVIRCFNVDRYISAVSALIYTFLPFWFARFIEHYWLAELQNAPFTLLLCYWIYTDSEFVRLKLQNKWLVTVVICILIANSGMGYYQFFSCFFVLSTGIIKFFDAKRYIYIYKTVLICTLITVFFAVNLVPVYIYNRENGYNHEIINRQALESELYGTKISYMLLPQYKNLSFNETTFERYANYMENAPLRTENTTAYLGYIGSLGFLFLIFYIFINPVLGHEVLFMLSRLNILAVLFSTIGGFSVLFAIYVTPLLRGMNRISIYIGFISILTIALLMDWWIKKGGNIYWRKIICLLTLSFGLFFQIPHSVFFAYDTYSEQWKNDKDFVNIIENNVSPQAAIWQMPYMPFPENGPINEMSDYSPIIGYIHSNSLKWSYGTCRGRKWDQEYKRVSGLPLDIQLDEIKAMGFAGIYIDIRGIGVEKYEEIKDKIIAKFGSYPIYHADNKRAFFLLDDNL